MVPGTMEEGTHYHTVSMMWCQAPGAELCTWTHHENRPPDWSLYRGILSTDEEYVYFIGSFLET